MDVDKILKDLKNVRVHPADRKAVIDACNALHKLHTDTGIRRSAQTTRSRG